MSGMPSMKQVSSNLANQWEQWAQIGLDLFPSLKDPQTPAEVDFIEKIVRQHFASFRNVRILDVCCGWGRHAIELGRRGYQVVGVDVSETFIAYAKRRAGSLRNVTFICKDFLYYRSPYKFDVVINMWTSFGFYPTPEQDLLMLKRISEALQRGGIFVLDLLNPAKLVHKFKLISEFDYIPGNRHWWYLEEQKEVFLSEINLDAHKKTYTFRLLYVGKHGQKGKATSASICTLKMISKISWSRPDSTS